jgi:prepilin-type N-terminal cleavage/methylation domain-containing protein
MKNRRGVTLLELVVSISIVGVFSTFAFARARSSLDALKVRGAREAFFGMVTRARVTAVERGGADLVFDFAGQTVSVQDRVGNTIESLSYDVAAAADGSNVSRLALHYDGHGIGRMTSRTIRLRKGAAEGGLTFSSYGRVRRW